MGLSLGSTFLLENISETVDSTYESILLKRLTKKGSTYTIKFNEA